MRLRYASQILKNYLAFSPIVGLIGHRQVGKTTLAEGLSSAYYTLDDEESLPYLVESAPEFLRESRVSGTLAIDEAQLMPSLFPALKEWVRKNKRPGQFLLTGSVRFTSQKSIRESLTGRIINLELLPLSIAEMSNEPAPEKAFSIHNSREFSDLVVGNAFDSASLKARMKQISDFSKTGGLPGICFVRDENLRAGRLRSQIDTILDRDLRMLYSTRASLSDLKQLVTFLANNQGQVLRTSAMQKASRTSARTSQFLVNALESLFLIRTIPLEGDLQGVVAFFEDPAEAQYMAGKRLSEEVQRIHLCYLFIRSSFAYRPGVEPQFFQFRTRAGVLVPVAVRQKDAHTGWIPIQGDNPNRREVAASKAFLAAYANSKVIFVNFESATHEVLDARRMIIPIAELTV